MAKLYFHFSTMNAGKSTSLLQASHNYREGGMQTYLITARLDHRAGRGRIASRIGIGEDADTFSPGEDLFAKLKARFEKGPVACVFIDEAQFLSKGQVWQLALGQACGLTSRAASSPVLPLFWPGPTKCARSARSAIAGRRPPWSSARGRTGRHCRTASR
jgi:Thymidine kinase